MKYLSVVLLSLVFQVADSQTLKVIDRFDRDLVGKEITVVDLEGYMANPVVKLTLVPGANVTLPLSLAVKASGPRFYFNTPSTTGANGPTKTIQINSVDGVVFYLSIFPDRDGENENYTFTILEGNTILTEIPIHIIDQDDPARPIEYPILHDFSRDTKGFTDDQNVRDVIIRAANDWAYFLQNMNFDEVSIGAETTWIWRDFFSAADPVNNSFAYSGYLLYSHGLVNTNHTSGGQPSTNAFQSSGGVPHSLRRSGTYSIEINGNYNTQGWNIDWTDDQWYLARNLSGNVPDLYSIAHHEMGHAFAFDQGYPTFNGYKTNGFINHPDIVAYMGQQPVDNFNHFASTIDKLSKRGVYGFEYANAVPLGRWLITKFDLLALKAVGYNLRAVSVFEPLVLDSEISLTDGTADVAYSHPTTGVSGGIPAHHWSLASGALPSGLTIDPFTGTISGIPREHGNFSFVVRVTDQEDKTIDSNEVDLSISPGAPPSMPPTLEGTYVNNSVNLSWEGLETDIGVKIERSSNDNSNFIEIATVDYPSHTYQDTDLVSHTKYFYRLVSYNSSGLSAHSGIVEITPPPTIASFEPSNAASGTQVTITGADLTGTTAVSFGGTAASSFTVVSATSISAIVANGASGSVNVTTPGGTATKAGFTFIPAPAILSFDPSNGATGTQVTITGADFTGATAVSFGGTAANSFTVVSPTSITAIVANGTSGNISVSTPGGTATKAGFTFIPAPAILSFEPSNAATGTQVNITGTDLSGATAVSFGGTAASSFTVVSSTNITATVANGSSGNVLVSTPGGTSTLGGFIYSVITSIDVMNTSERILVQVFPNPSSGVNVGLKLDLSWKGQRGNLSVSDISGRIVYQTSILCSPEVELSFDNEKLRPGVYLLTLVSAEKKARTKLIVME